MNKLFNILMRGCSIPLSFSWYAKRSEVVPATERVLELVDIVMTGVPLERRAMVASQLCNLVLYTQYGPEIKKLDPNNTYVPVTRDPNVAHTEPTYCMHDLIQPIKSYKPILGRIDDDIRNTLDEESWLDMMGAACLQMLREVS
jgi:hypothetical protein